MKFEKTVSHLLSRVATAHKRHIERRLNEIGLHGGQAMVLFELWKRDGMRQIDLAKNLSVSAPTINKTVGGLAAIGLVVNERIDGDARSTRVFLTDEGSKMRDSIDELWFEIEEEILTELTETERLVLFDLLTKLSHYYLGTEHEE